VGMTLEVLILLYFQTKSGVLYQDIGILLTGFMAGLSFGAYETEKIYGRAPKAVGFVLLGGSVGWWINAGRGAGLPESLVPSLQRAHWLPEFFLMRVCMNPTIKPGQLLHYIPQILSAAASDPSWSA